MKECLLSLNHNNYGYFSTNPSNQFEEDFNKSREKL